MIDLESMLIGIGAGLFAVIAVRLIDAIMEKKK